MFEKASHGDLILARFEKVCRIDKCFENHFLFLISPCNAAMSLASVWYVNRKKISRRINLYTALTYLAFTSP